MGVSYSDSVKFDSVVVIESLRPDDKNTGRGLYRDVLCPLEDADPDLKVSFHQASDRREFLACLDAAHKQFSLKDRWPILHLETHGDESGLWFGDDSTLDWEDLRRILTAMNRACKVNLLVVLALCKGHYLHRILHPLQPTPVWGLMGPDEDVWDYDLQQAMHAFYRELFTSFDAKAALEKVNDNLPFADWVYRLETAEVMFCRIFAKYMEDAASGEELRERENRIVSEIVRRNGLDITAAYDARLRAKQMLSDHKGAYDFYKTSFLMLDEFPENSRRFRLTYEECMAAREGSGGS